jgi:hypothetical protein
LLGNNGNTISGATDLYVRTHTVSLFYCPGITLATHSPGPLRVRATLTLLWQIYSPSCPAADPYFGSTDIAEAAVE